MYTLESKFAFSIPIFKPKKSDTFYPLLVILADNVTCTILNETGGWMILNSYLRMKLCSQKYFRDHNQKYIIFPKLNECMKGTNDNNTENQ